MEKCKICGKEFKRLLSLRMHMSRIHKMSSQDFYDDWYLSGERPKCKCGCGEDTSFISFDKGYNEWIRGHISRVKNNWGHNPEALRKSAETGRKQFESGERVVWNAGLTMETDERVKNNMQSLIDFIQNNPLERKRRSDWMRDARKNKKEFRSRYGPESAHWKGGTSTINMLTRANKRLYDEWIFPILAESGFKCGCGNTKQLEVHHNGETMAEIIRKFVDKSCDYTFDEKREIMHKVIDYHRDNKVDGEVLCKPCHVKLHPSYNY